MTPSHSRLLAEEMLRAALAPDLLPCAVFMHGQGRSGLPRGPKCDTRGQAGDQAVRSRAWVAVRQRPQANGVAPMVSYSIPISLRPR